MAVEMPIVSNQIGRLACFSRGQESVTVVIARDFWCPRSCTSEQAAAVAPLVEAVRAAWFMAERN